MEKGASLTLLLSLALVRIILMDMFSLKHPLMDRVATTQVLNDVLSIRDAYG